MNLWERYGRKLRNLCEVGVNEPHLSQLKPWLESGEYDHALLVEPHPVAGPNCERAFEGLRGVKVLRCAVVLNPVNPVKLRSSIETVELIDHGQSSFVASLPNSPARANGEREDGPRFHAPCVTFDQIDPGDLDLLCVDTEGSEWAVIAAMQSNPKVIRLETHFTGSGYVNPYLGEILEKLLPIYEVVHIGPADMVFEFPGAFS